MKPVFETVEFTGDNSIRVHSYQCEAFQDDHAWHYHPEYELSYIVSGQGTRFVGDSVEPYQSGDLVLLGPNIPHCWISQNANDGIKQTCEMIVIQFPFDCFGEKFMNIPEAKLLKDLLKSSERGIYYYGDIEKQAHKQMKEIDGTKGLVKISVFLKLLDSLCKEDNRKYLSSENYTIDDKRFQDDRMKNILDYLQNNLLYEIKQSEVANLVGMAPQSFSRYFKSTTGRTFVSFVNVMRISKACQELITTEKDIIDISLGCGYSSLSNFNRQFSELKGTTPREYRRKHKEIRKNKILSE